MVRILLALGSLSIAAAQTTINLQLSSSIPAGSSDYVSPSFAGFGIEPSNLFSYTGYSTPNQLTFNLIDNLIGYTGAPPHMRIGGNTEDYMIFDATMEQWTWINNPNPSGQGAFKANSMLIGPKFFQAANRFAQGTPVTWGLNLAYEEPDYIQQIVTMAKQVVQNTPNLKLVSFEIGNEPDLYLQNSFRSGSWGGSPYIQDWTTRAQAIYDQVLKPAGIGANFFEPACTASTIGTSFQVHDLTELGITQQANGTNTSFLASWNQHDYYYYIGVSGYPLTMEKFMTLTTTSDQFAAWVTQIQQAKATGYPYALREMGVVGPIGLEGITNTFGAALWTLNFLLYSASLNITSVQIHQTDNSNASAWQPININGRDPFVRPAYYGYAAFDQVLGPGCQTQVAPYTGIQYPNNYAGKVAAYSIYQSGQLQSVVMLNTQLANVSMTNKGSLQFTMQWPTSYAGKTLHLAYLTANGTDATSGTTFNGISYEQSGDGTPRTVSNTDQTVQIGSDGSATVTIRDSQAVIANVNNKVGAGQTSNPTACAALASRSPGIGATTTSQRSAASSSNAASSVSGSMSSTSPTSASTTSATNGVKRIAAMCCSTLSLALIVGVAVLL